MALRKPKPVIQPSWHPNFRDEESLPDIKVIRTDFLLNFVAVVVVAGLLAFLGYREFRAFSIASVVEGLEENIAANSAENTTDLRLSGQFKRDKKMIDELEAFTTFNVPIRPLDFLLEIAANKPDEIELDSISYASGSITVGRKASPTKTIRMTGKVFGTPDSATQTLNDFLQLLNEAETLRERLYEEAPVSLQSFNRSGNLNEFTFAIQVQFTPPA